MAVVTLTKGMLLPLNDVERALGVWMGTSRNNTHPAGSTPTYNGEDVLVRNIGAATAEIAIARQLNLYPDLQFCGDLAGLGIC